MVRRRLAAVALAAGLALAGGSAVGAPAWTVDPATSRLGFTTRQGAQPIEGAFTRWTARIRFDASDLAGSSVEVVVDLASVASGDPARDKQAQSAEFFDSARTPEARYRTRAFRALGGDRFEVDADLSMKGVTRPLTHTVRIVLDGDRATAEGEVALSRREFGFGSGLFESEQILAAEIRVRFSLRATRP
jgi:polyisoprenoid-binding protein YceI